MRALEKALTIFIALTPMCSFADWKYDENTDEMRGEKMISASVESSTTLQSSQSNQATLTITSVRSGHGSGFYFQLKEGKFSCVPELCDVSMKFDDGKVLDLKAMGDKEASNIIHVQNPNLFVATARISKRLIVEVPLYKHGKTQFKFDISGLTWDGQTPSKDGLYGGVGGQTWASPYDPATGFVDNGVGEGEDRCYTDPKPTTTAFGAKPTKITHCYYQGRHYISMVDFEFSKIKQVVNSVSKQVGKPELEIKEYVSWSGIEENNLLSIGILASKKSNVATLLITYVPAGNLVPPRKPVAK